MIPVTLTVIDKVGLVLATGPGIATLVEKVEAGVETFEVFLSFQKDCEVIAKGKLYGLFIESDIAIGPVKQQQIALELPKADRLKVNIGDEILATRSWVATYTRNLQ